MITSSKNIVYLVIKIKRALFQKLNDKFNKGKAIVLLGPRQVGKTTLINTCLEGKDFLLLNGDDPEIRNLLENTGVSKLRLIIGKNTLVFIDEAQRIKDIGKKEFIIKSPKITHIR